MNDLRATAEAMRLEFIRTGKLPGNQIPRDAWPVWAKGFAWLARSQDKGIGDVVARVIGDENSDKFKAWHRMTFGKPCNCTARQATWNAMYPL